MAIADLRVPVPPEPADLRQDVARQGALAVGGATGSDDGENAWRKRMGSNPPRDAERRATGFEDREAHRDPSAPRNRLVLPDRPAASVPRADSTSPPANDRHMNARPDLPPFRLTALTDCGGCAAKLGADLLADALSGLGAVRRAAGADRRPGRRRTMPPPTGSPTTSRSSARSISSRRSWTTPRRSGQIAAANALSDVFAMGGRVLFALSIAAFPEELPRGRAGGRVRGCRRERARGGWRAGGRPHDPRSRAQVRPGRGRAPRTRTGCCARAARGRATCCC